MISYLKYIFLFISVLILQFLFLNNLILFDTAFCFIYIAFILLLPIETSPLLLLFLGFIIGFSVDIFSDTLGMNAAASVLIAFLRPYILKLLTPRSGYELNFQFTIYKTGVVWYASYAATLIFIHLLFLFILDGSDTALLPSAFLKAILSTIFTVIVFIIGSYLFQSSKSK